jgi:hypothetical protein
MWACKSCSNRMWRNFAGIRSGPKKVYVMLHENTYELYGLIFFQKMKLQSCTPLCPTCYESLAFLKLVFHDFFLDDTGHHT